MNNRQGVKRKFPQESEERNVGNHSKKNRTEKENIEPPPQSADLEPVRPNHNPTVEKNITEIDTNPIETNNSRKGPENENHVFNQSISFGNLGFLSLQQSSSPLSKSLSEAQVEDSFGENTSKELEIYENDEEPQINDKEDSTETPDFITATAKEVSSKQPKQVPQTQNPNSLLKAPTVKAAKKYYGKPTNSPKTLKKKMEIKPKSKRAVQQSFKNGFGTLKDSIKYLQVKNGLPQDFLLIVKNNSQNIKKFGSSKSASKYLSFGAGSLGSKFFSTEGVAYNPKDYFLVKDDATIDEDIPLTLKMTEKKLYIYESESEKDTIKKKRGVHNSESETDTDITVMKKKSKKAIQIFCHF